MGLHVVVVAHDIMGHTIISGFRRSTEAYAAVGQQGE